MKYFMIGIFLTFFIISCTSPDSKDNPFLKSSKKLSTTQSWIREFKRNLVKDYKAAPNDIAKTSIAAEYRSKIHRYLYDSCGLIMDSMYVKVNDLSQDGTLISGTFEDDYAEYVFGTKFTNLDSMNKSPIYNFIKGLIVNKDTVMKLFYLAEVKINNPLNEYENTIEIQVIPAPLETPINKPKKK